MSGSVTIQRSQTTPATILTTQPQNQSTSKYFKVAKHHCLLLVGTSRKSQVKKKSYLNRDTFDVCFLRQFCGHHCPSQDQCRATE